MIGHVAYAVGNFV